MFDMMNISTVWNMLHQNLPELIEDLSFDDVMKICGILDANSFRIDKHGTRGVFLATSMVKYILLNMLSCLAAPFSGAEL